MKFTKFGKIVCCPPPHPQLDPPLFKIILIGGSKGGAPGTRAPPWGSKFFHFHAVFGKNLKNNSNFGSWRTPLGKILDPPLILMTKSRFKLENLLIANIKFTLDYSRVYSSGCSCRLRGRGAEKHEIYAAAFGGHFFMTKCPFTRCSCGCDFFAATNGLHWIQCECSHCCSCSNAASSKWVRNPFCAAVAVAS